MYSPDRYVAALQFAARRHIAQKVPGTDLPYVVHVASVANEVIAALPAPDADLAVQCALLHDTIEDAGVTFAELEQAFGPDVAHGVQALSKDPSLPKSQQMADSLDRIRAQPPAVWMVKLGDRITNLQPPPHYWTLEKRTKYRDEAIVIADALAGVSEVLDRRIREKIAAYR